MTELPVNSAEFAREPFSAASHLLWFILAMPALAFLLKFDSRPKQIVYSLTMLFCFGASAICHASFNDIARYKYIDQVCVYMFISGSYTVILKNNKAIVFSWLLTFTAILIRSTIGFYEEIFLLVGIGPALYPGSYNHIFPRPVAIGNIFYISGAIINYLRWPNPIPHFINAHELFHIFVMIAATSHYIYVLKNVAMPVKLSREGQKVPVETVQAARA